MYMQRELRVGELVLPTVEDCFKSVLFLVCDMFVENFFKVT